MALRVLLADESSTIKKVFQLALQDFAVDVRPVNVGVDVVPVAQNFKPDIVFADVLLQKRSGYEVAADLKHSPDLKDVPVVLMWSGFMELDEDKFQASQANAQLEKPFDVAALRKLVGDLVPRTQNQKLSEFLTFPKMPEFDEAKPQAAAPQPPVKAASVEPPPPPGASVSPVSAAEPEEDFQQISIPKMKGAQDKYRLNLKPEELDPDHVPVDFTLDQGGSDEDEADQFSLHEPTRTPAHDEIELEPAEKAVEPRPATAARATSPAASSLSTSNGLSAEQLEKVIREQSAEIIESVVWKVVPDLAAQIIERELKRLLKERDAQPF
jgi:CheY-like chemotaxis protein